MKTTSLAATAILGIGCLLVADSTPAAEPFQLQKLRPTEAAENDFFGRALSLRGDRLVIGSAHEDLVGTAYVFERDAVTGSWIQTARLRGPSTSVVEEFGRTVSTDGDVVAVGAPDSLLLRAGAAFVFERDGATGEWLQVAGFRAPSPQTFAQFGSSVSVSGTTLAIGEPAAGIDFIPGKVHMYERDAVTEQWLLTTIIRPSDGDRANDFARRLMLDGDTLVVGADSDNDAGPNSGAAYVYERDETSGEWLSVAKLGASDAGLNTQFGTSVSVRGGTIAVGAPGLGADFGAAYVFERDQPSGQWLETARLEASDGVGFADFGATVAVGDAGSVVVGAPLHNDFGAAYVFTRDAGTGEWLETSRLLPSDIQIVDFFGTRAAIDGDLIMVSSTSDDDVSPDGGAVYAFGVGGIAGSVTGLRPRRVRCTNETSGQTVRMVTTGSTWWDCSAAGLDALAGDELSLSVTSDADGFDVSGALSEWLPEGITCRNEATLDEVFVGLLPGESTWNCTAAGLAAAKGERVTVTASGSLARPSER